MREASQRRMMQQLPEADVVITNPTHLACAIKYDKTQAEAPILLAKGADFLAQKIKEEAKKNDIPIVENKPLARMLYHNVELNEEIPEELYQMTAEVLAYDTYDHIARTVHSYHAHVIYENCDRAAFRKDCRGHADDTAQPGAYRTGTFPYIFHHVADSYQDI